MGALSFQIALFFYLLAMLAAFFDLFKSTRILPKAAYMFVIVGFLFHTTNVVYSWFADGHIPIVNAHEATSFFAWCVFLLFLLLEYSYKLGLLGSFIIPIGFALTLVSSVLSSASKPLTPQLRSYWLGIHTFFAFMSSAAFALAAGLAFMYLVQEHHLKRKRLGGLFERLPSLQRLDEISYRLITMGFPLFTLAIISGSIWADNAWGSYLSWEPIQVWSIITWLIFAVVFHSRLLAGWRGRRAAVLSIIGFATIIIAFAGLALLQKGQHIF
ncbi:MAG: c-type cytochrome biogenesis protein CcsB [Actinomycetota bacterium]|nr:c-type cytochrome biogenesis protein CcsB [Actinomycetota bacterium]